MSHFLSLTNSIVPNWTTNDSTTNSKHVEYVIQKELKIKKIGKFSLILQLNIYLIRGQGMLLC